MRRSNRIATLTLGSACLLVLASCSENEPGVFQSVDDCLLQTGDRGACEQDQQAALKMHEETAPKYEQQASCEEVYGEGKCVPAQSAGGGSWFMPAMMGFMMGRMMGGGSAMPVYHDRRGYAYAGGKPWQGYGTAASSSRSGSTVSRGGFGSTGRSFSISS